MRSIVRLALCGAARIGSLPLLAGLLFAAVGMLGALAGPTYAEDEEGDTAPNPPVKPKEPAEPKAEARKPILPDVLAKLKANKALVEAARGYFDLDEQPWRGRKGILKALDLEADKGRLWLKDMDALRWLVYQGRSFEPPMTDRKWRNAQGIPEYKSLGGTLHWIKSEHLTIAFSIPKKYPKAKDLRSKYPRRDPYPLLLTIHEKRDYTGQRYPGEVLLKRRFPKKVWGSLYEEWLVLCPIAAAGNYLNAQNMIRREAFQDLYAIFWKHYHVDFDRVILDGTEQAFQAAAALPIFFAGIVFRSGKGKKWELSSDEMKTDVKNFAHVPVYVVDNPKLAEQLEEAGHLDVTAGISGANLFKWMQKRRRVEPKKFDWVIQRGDQLLPYWVNLEGLDWNSKVRKLEVESLDTEEEPNTVKIKATGVHTLALFLNDEIVDLDRKVRVLINGHVEHDGLVETGNPGMDKLGRNFDVLFDRDPSRIRLSMFFGWLKSARIVELRVRPPEVKKKDDAGKKDTPDTPKANPAEEERAKRLMDVTKKLLGKGNEDAARKKLQAILKLPRNAQTVAATKMLADLVEPGDGEKK